MANVKFHKVTTLPGSLDANALYFVSNGTYSETYLTDSAGTAKSVGNSAMIEAVAGALITTSLSNLNTVEIVADITARNALASNNRNMMVMVLDATGDATVASGAALYVFRNSDNSWTKIAEYEGLDVSVAWASISGKPTSSAANIDDAVTKRHTHTNQTQLDQISEDGSQNLVYRGILVGTSWNTNNW